MHYSSLSFSKPWESYRLRVLPSQSAGVTSLPYITTTTPASSEGIPLYPSPQAVSLPGTGGPSMTELRGTSDTKVIMVNCLKTYDFTQIDSVLNNLMHIHLQQI